MKKIAIIYYSGTNNTLYIVNELERKLSENIITKISVFENNVDFSDYDLIIICYPIYAFNCPIMLEKYISKSNIFNKKYLIIKNSGEPLKLNNASSWKIFRMLKKRKCTLINEIHLLMPYYIIFRHDIRMVKQMLVYNNRYLDYTINNYLNANSSYTIKYKLIRELGKLQRFGALVNSKLFKTNSNCNKCCKCLKQCPTKNINLINNKITFHNHCLMCMKCVVNCPNNAIIPGFLNKWKVNKEYDLISIINDEAIVMNYLQVCSKRFLKVYKKYYDRLDNLLN